MTEGEVLARGAAGGLPEAPVGWPPFDDTSSNGPLPSQVALISAVMPTQHADSPAESDGSAGGLQEASASCWCSSRKMAVGRRRLLGWEDLGQSRTRSEMGAGFPAYKRLGYGLEAMKMAIEWGYTPAREGEPSLIW
ncbi:uncharacterized protein TrAtP1_002326 [Trichoderma atroviride]|uniref:uncharacterized protein n=1 Tax=Hypocrea atroviridis TaxID=63577 RepID=UPI00332AE7E0|nr:hypothetical protein TrAtP1_002326 [Trichoderma atroviride]